MSIIQNITEKDGWFVGEDQNIIWGIIDSQKSPVPTSLWTSQFRMATTVSGSSVLTQSGTGAGTEIEVDFAAADTASLDPGTYYYTLSRTDSGFNAVVAHGSVFLQARVL
jgi:hypothetical protein